MKKVKHKLTIIILLFMISAGCKRTNYEPEELNKHLIGKVYDETDGERIPNCRIGLYQHTPDGSLSSTYKKIAETFSDTSGNYEFHFTKIKGSSYAIQLEKSPPSFTEEAWPTFIQPQEERKQEINFDIKVKPLANIKWHVIGDQGNYKCTLGIGGGGEYVYNGQDLIFWESRWANQQTEINYGVMNNGVIVKDTSYSVYLPKHDTVFVTIHF